MSHDDSEPTPSDRRHALGLHDVTCQGQNGPCWCQEDGDDEVVYPEPAEAVRQ